MDIFLKDILEPSQRDIFNLLTQMKTTMAVPFHNSMKDRFLLTGNIGIPPHLIHSCQWPAYTTHTSPVVKMLVELDKLRIAKFLGRQQVSSPGPHRSESIQAHITQKKYIRGSQEAGVAAEPSPALSQFSMIVSPFGFSDVSPKSYSGFGVPSSFSPVGSSATELMDIGNESQIRMVYSFRVQKNSNFGGN
ncbi:CMT1A duplicated region transcript 4 protein homolog [Elgaria multicarinata webbii]|uniref:CMT1A duplicated region transcript 4 protein homolog n=1 Tax=Elgaria multicarinata webbii TaxID=159646 RepID=UPI002FCCD93A